MVEAGATAQEEAEVTSRMRRGDPGVEAEDEETRGVVPKPLTVERESNPCTYGY